MIHLTPAGYHSIIGLQQGDFFIGPAVNFVNHSLRNITEYIAKREDSDEYVIFKVLHCAHDGEMNNGHQSQGKALLHNEHLILSLLQDQPRVIHQHGLFKFRNKFILVLDCLMPHEYDKKGLYKHFINLQQYVIQKKRLQEKEALEIFLQYTSNTQIPSSGMYVCNWKLLMWAHCNSNSPNVSPVY